MMTADSLKSPADQAALLQIYRDALARTDALIDPVATGAAKRPEDVRVRAIERLARLRRLLTFLGDPHLTVPTIHVGGTSGKGSTSVAIASILSAAGYRVGLHTSPYLQVATEKLHIVDRLVSASEFAAAVARLERAVERWDEGPVTYGEFWFALVASVFATSNLDFAVIEVGAGGRFDLTNVVQPRVSVITTVGIDHTETLGSTIEEIAWHKAGIAKPGVPVVTAADNPAAFAVIETEAAAVGSPLIRVAHDITFEQRLEVGSILEWREIGAMSGDRGPRLPIPMAGSLQVINAATAVAAIRALNETGVVVSDNAIEHGLRVARLPGRVETMQIRPTVILDGAHNPQKVAALIADLPILRRESPARLICVAGTLGAKDHRAIVSALSAEADVMIVTEPRVLAKPSTDPAQLSLEAIERGFTGTVVVEPNPTRAVELALALAAEDDLVLVTGSLYLVGNVRAHWYLDDDILLQQTSWTVSSLPQHTTQGLPRA